ncbi:MAG TPA: EAL domain-containing response regulator [Stellaceae bacterium]|nr:EAL domain-containing response regulator [Stellaceae bacterium]
MGDELLSSRLLIIDDDEAFVRFVRRVAVSLGFEVATTTDADEFRMLAKSWCPTLIVLDLNMPGCDGVELLRHLALAHCGAHVVIASGLDDRTLETTLRLGAERGLKMGGALAKPAALQTLRDLLTRFVMVDERALIDELDAAIKGDQLFLQYQPKLDCHAGRMTGVEALVRWRHPTRGTIPPDQFIALAETHGMIDRLTDWVVSRAACQAAEWLQQGLPLEIAINISAKNTQDIDLPDRLVELCRAGGTNPASIILELTETSAMRDAVQMMDVLTRLRVKGFRLSIDDFGTGYSSLVQLQRMPFSELKVDRSFVMQMNKSRDCRVIVEIVIDLARKLGLKSVAEGVESQGILDELLRLDCDAAQGYHLSRPIDAARIPETVQGYAAAAAEIAA